MPGLCIFFWRCQFCCVYWNVPRKMVLAASDRWSWWHENDGCYANSSHLLNFNSKIPIILTYCQMDSVRYSFFFLFPAPYSTNAYNKMIWKYVDFLLLVDDTVFDWFVSKFPRFSFHSLHATIFICYSSARTHNNGWCV